MLKVNILYSTLILSLFFLPLSLLAQGGLAAATFRAFIYGTFSDLVSTFIVLLMAVGLLVFLWGVAKFIMRADSEAERAKGKQVMIWGLISLFVMLSLWGIVYIVTMTFFSSGEINFFLPE